MRKGIHFLVLLAAALLLFSLPVRASDFEDDSLYFVTDEAGLLTDEEWTALETRAEELSTEYACGIYVITVDDFRNYTTDEDVYEAAKSLYQEYRLGYGEEQSGTMRSLPTDTGTRRLRTTERTNFPRSSLTTSGRTAGTRASPITSKRAVPCSGRRARETLWMWSRIP